MTLLTYVNRYMPSHFDAALRVKPLGAIGSTKDGLLGFAAEVVREVGHAFCVAQTGGKHAAAKPLKRFGGTTVLEIVESHDGNACRVVYTVRFREIIYLPHASRKKSKRGIAAPPQELDKVNAGLMQAEQEYET
jgi:phage-related protein